MTLRTLPLQPSGASRLTPPGRMKLYIMRAPLRSSRHCSTSSRQLKAHITEVTSTPTSWPNTPVPMRWLLRRLSSPATVRRHWLRSLTSSPAIFSQHRHQPQLLSMLAV